MFVKLTFEKKVSAIFMALKKNVIFKFGFDDLRNI
jgi:hypothetical protein